MEKRGFTRFELWVVIAVIVIVATVAFTFLMHVRQAARVADSEGQMKETAYGLNRYSGDNNGMLPPLSAPANPGK